MLAVLSAGQYTFNHSNIKMILKIFDLKKGNRDRVVS